MGRRVEQFAHPVEPLLLDLLLDRVSFLPIASAKHPFALLENRMAIEFYDLNIGDIKFLKKIDYLLVLVVEVFQTL